MKVYLTIRFGHAESPDGPDGEDTVFLVRAADFSDAARLTDAMLLDLPTTSPQSKRPVEAACHRVIELGEDSGSAYESEIIGGPWIGGDHRFDCRTYPMWVRDWNTCNEWKEAREVFGYD